MHLTVTGATGFIGSAVARVALERGHRVTALVRKPNDDRFAAHEHLVQRHWDLADPATVGNALDGVDALLHLAALVPARYDDPAFAEPCFRANALASRELAETAARRGVAHFVYSSTGALYTAGPSPSTENESIAPPVRAPYYLTSKFAGESFVAAECARHGTRLTTVRIASAYGPGMQSSSVVARFIDAARRGASLNVVGGDHTADFVYVDDVALAIVIATERRVTGTLNVGTGVATSIRQLAEVVRDISDASCEIVDDGAVSMRSGFAALDIRRAVSALDWHPMDLRSGLRAMMRGTSDHPVPRHTYMYRDNPTTRDTRA